QSCCGYLRGRRLKRRRFEKAHGTSDGRRPVARRARMCNRGLKQLPKRDAQLGPFLLCPMIKCGLTERRIHEKITGIKLQRCVEATGKRCLLELIQVDCDSRRTNQLDSLAILRYEVISEGATKPVQRLSKC